MILLLRACVLSLALGISVFSPLSAVLVYAMEDAEDANEDEIKRDDLNRLCPPPSTLPSAADDGVMPTFHNDPEAHLSSTEGDFSKLPSELVTSVILPFLTSGELLGAEQVSRGVCTLVFATYPQLTALAVNYSQLLQKRRYEPSYDATLESFLRNERRAVGMRHLKKLSLNGRFEPSSEDIQALGDFFPELEELALIATLDSYDPSTKRYLTFFCRLEPSVSKTLSLNQSLRKLHYQAFAGSTKEEIKSLFRELKNCINLQIIVLQLADSLQENDLSELALVPKLDSLIFFNSYVQREQLSADGFYFQTAIQNLKRCSIHDYWRHREIHPISRYPLHFLDQVAHKAQALHTLAISVDYFLIHRPSILQTEPLPTTLESKESFRELKHLHLFEYLKSVDFADLDSFFKTTPLLETFVFTKMIEKKSKESIKSLKKDATEEKKEEKNKELTQQALKSTTAPILDAITALAKNCKNMRALAIRLKTIGGMRTKDFPIDWPSRSELLCFLDLLVQFPNLQTLSCETDSLNEEEYEQKTFTELLQKNPSLKTLEIVSIHPLSKETQRKLSEIRPGLHIISTPDRYTQLPTDMDTW